MTPGKNDLARKENKVVMEDFKVEFGRVSVKSSFATLVDFDVDEIEPVCGFTAELIKGTV